jgi:hypothetical protein
MHIERWVVLSYMRRRLIRVESKFTAKHIVNDIILHKYVAVLFPDIELGLSQSGKEADTTKSRVFNNRVLRNIFWSKRVEVREGGENCIMRSMIVLFTQYY